jgi:Zn-dependent protease
LTHESAHAYVAFRFGDPTAKNLGRITLNPIPHIDIFGLIAIFLVHFGWAKPVPVDPNNLRNPVKDNLWIALSTGFFLLFFPVPMPARSF